MKKFFQALAIPIGIGLLFVPFAVSTPEIAKKENKGCLTCHTAVGKADLNDAGKYYKEKKTLEGYKPKPSGQ
ncbi:MAG: hypothetical protein HY646_13510 [Acidobacteria bacterium]|nr:hypothetical protein [Acidobacteriota bacterium]